jgi:hypothetical protein
MALLLQVTGLPATGKSFSLKTLDPKETFIIDTDQKGMSYSGWRSQYNATNKNYVRESDIGKIKSYISAIVKSRPHIKIIVLDTLNTILTDYLQDERRKPGFDVWKNLADDAYDLYSFANSQERAGDDNLIIIFLCHAEEYDSVNTQTGLKETHLRTLFPGKQATKSRLSKFTNYNLYTFLDIDETEEEKRFNLRTQNLGFCEARSVYGVLPKFMSNDLGEVIRLIRKYDLEIPETTSTTT